jgi:hypothetical protein
MSLLPSESRVTNDPLLTVLQIPVPCHDLGQEPVGPAGGEYTAGSLSGKIRAMNAKASINRSLFDD